MKTAKKFLKKEQIRDVTYMSWDGSLSELLGRYIKYRMPSDKEIEKHKYEININITDIVGKDVQVESWMIDAIKRSVKAGIKIANEQWLKQLLS